MDAGSGDATVGFVVPGDVTAPVREWVRELPEPHASLFRLLYVEGLKQRDVAVEVGKSQNRESLVEGKRVGLGGGGLVEKKKRGKLEVRPGGPGRPPGRVLGGPTCA